MGEEDKKELNLNEEAEEVVDESEMPENLANKPVTSTKVKLPPLKYQSRQNVGYVEFPIKDIDIACACLRDVESWLFVMTGGKANIKHVCGKKYYEGATFFSDTSYDGNKSVWQRFMITECKDRDLTLTIDVTTGKKYPFSSSIASKSAMCFKLQADDEGRGGYLSIEMPEPPINLCRNPILFTFCPFACLGYAICGNAFVEGSLKCNLRLLQDHIENYVVVISEIPKRKKSRSLSASIVPKVNWLSIRKKKKKT